jgi:hypothetical protein
VDHSEGLLNRNIYNSPHIIESSIAASLPLKSEFPERFTRAISKGGGLDNTFLAKNFTASIFYRDVFFRNMAKRGVLLLFVLKVYYGL